MGAVNRAIAQLKDLFTSMTPGTRVATALLLAVIVISLFFLFNQDWGGRGTYLMGGRPFSPSEMPAIHAAFAAAGLPEPKYEGNRILVPAGQEAAYVTALAEAGAMPADFHSYLEKTLADQGPFVGPRQRDELIKNAKQKKLAAIIASMQGIEFATVDYDERREGGLSRRVTCTASVSVKPVLNQQLDPDQARIIRHLVSAAFAGLKPESVTIADLNGRVYVGSGDSSVDGEEHQYLRVMHAYENLFRQRVQDALAYVSGATVNVNVELSPELESSREKTTLDDKASGTLYQSEQTSLRDSNSGPPGGRPGVVAQQGNANQATQLAGARVTHSVDETSSSQRQTIPAHETVRSKAIGLLPQRVTVAIGIPSSHYEMIWRNRNPVQPGQQPAEPDPAQLRLIEQEEQEKIQRHVAQLLPASAGVADLEPLVKVTTFEHVAAASPEGESSVDAGLAWLSQNWMNVGVLLLGLGSLLFLRSIVRGTPAPATVAAAAPTLNVVSPDDERGSEAAESPAPKRMLKRPKGEMSLRDELTQLVKEDPDAAASVIKGWIGGAS